MFARFVAVPLLAVGAAAVLAPSAAPVVTVTARDFAFDAPDTIAAGPTTIRLVNRGPDLHHVALVQLGAHTADEYLKAIQKGAPPAWARDMGGPNTPAPGKESSATVTLTSGNYIIVCWIPASDGVMHVKKGMLKPITVVGAREAKATPAAAAPAADVTLALTDYTFTLSKPLVAGTQTIRVRNDAEQPHEILLARLAPGKTAADLLAWLEKQQGPPPGEPIGGTTGMATGIVNDLTVTLTPGEYAFICFLPDAEDGKPHFTHGMIQQVSIR